RGFAITPSRGAQGCFLPPLQRYRAPHPQQTYCLLLRHKPQLFQQAVSAPLLEECVCHIFLFLADKNPPKRAIIAISSLLARHPLRDSFSCLALRISTMRLNTSLVNGAMPLPTKISKLKLNNVKIATPPPSFLANLAFAKKSVNRR